MARFSRTSSERLFTCDDRLQLLCHDVIPFFDFSVLCGHRGREEQNAAKASGHSTLGWPYSRHNKFPSLAVDLAPWPIDWNDIERFMELSRLMKLAAACRGIELTWGGDWQSFVDMPHYQVEPLFDAAATDAMLAAVMTDRVYAVPA